jgi:hypothetical protein
MQEKLSHEKTIHYERSLFGLHSLGIFMVIAIFSAMLKGLISLLALYQR